MKGFSRIWIGVGIFLFLIAVMVSFFGGENQTALAQPGGVLFISDVESALDTDGTGSFTVATGHSCPCMILANEDATATNSVTVTQTFAGGGSGTFVLRGAQSVTLGCTDRYPMFTVSVSWTPDAGNPDVRYYAWEL